ncbi:MAG: Crp/Fnr family transcriptional regulator [Firmicutes bacterium]|nr:Crp/Fnr family transcriptional regulator [Bacillota bacterium]MCM1401500.1 Crp/Fnr family transcriptional regulator [Bacteroides sp.]MCM1477350.1 Crp/Fnr family transcriptional regulator [Bacteroides sp.]
MDSMYENLMELPLFKGVSFDRISDIVGATRFHFLKYAPGETITEAGEKCTHIKFVISGAARLVTLNSGGRLRVAQTIKAPEVIAPDFLFGRFTNYPCSVTAVGATGILQIAKLDYLKILHSDDVFLINFLNTLSINAQKSVIGVLALTNGSLEERIAFWIVALTQRGSTNISLQCKQRDFYSLFGVQRSSFMATLDSMAERGLVEYDQREIRFPSRPALVELLTNPQED